MLRRNNEDPYAHEYYSLFTHPTPCLSPLPYDINADSPKVIFLDLMFRY